MGKRPDGRIASDRKSYMVTHTLFDSSEEQEKKGLVPFWMVNFTECSEDEGCVIVREWTEDKFLCPVCTEGRNCYPHARVYGFSELKKGLRKGKEMYFRLVAKECPKVTVHLDNQREEYEPVYIVEQIFNPREHIACGRAGELFERRVLNKFNRFIERKYFANRCLACPTPKPVRTHALPGAEGWLTRASCQNCFLKFYVVESAFVAHEDFEKRCAACSGPIGKTDIITIEDIDCAKCPSCGWRCVVPVNENLFPERHKEYLQKLLAGVDEFNGECEIHSGVKA